MLGRADIASILADLALVGGTVEVTLSGVTVHGISDREAGETLDGDGVGVVAEQEVVHVETGALPGLTSGASITVGGHPYIVRQALPYGDGAMTRIVLRSA